MRKEKKFIIINKKTGSAYSVRDYEDYNDKNNSLEWNLSIDDNDKEKPKFSTVKSLSLATKFTYETGKDLLERQVGSKSMSNIKFNTNVVLGFDGKKKSKDDNFKLKNLMLVELIEQGGELKIHPFYYNYLEKE